MADQTATFAIVLKDEASGAALTAAQALSKLESQITSETKQLGALQRAMKNLQGATKPNVEQINALKLKMDAHKQSIAKAQSSYISLGGTFRSTTTGARGFSARLAELAERANGVPGPLGALTGRLNGIKSLVVGGGAIAVGVLAIAAALTALVVASAAATRALYRYGVAQADARRSELLRLEGLTKMRFFYARMPGNAKDMQDALDRVAAKVPASRAELAKYNDQLYRMGVRGPQLEKALEGVGIKLSTQGEEAASSFAAFAGGAAITGRSVDKLVDRVKDRLGGIAQRQMSSLTVQAQKQQEAFDALFSGLKIDPFLNAWKEVRDLLGQATASGRALKLIITNVLQPLIGASTSGAPLMKRFFQGMIISALQLTLVVLALRAWFRKTFGDVQITKGIDGQKLAVLAGKTALGGLVIGLTLASVAVVGLAMRLTGWFVPALLRATLATLKFSFGGITRTIAAFGRMAAAAWSAVPALWAAVAPMLPFVLAALGLGAAVYQLVKYWDELVIAFEQVDWGQLGIDIMTGLVRGLVGGPLFEKMKELATGAIAAFKQAIGSASPSKAFMRVGYTIPQGVAAGVVAGSPEAQAASSQMVDAAAAAPNIGPPPGARGALDEPAAPAAKGGKGGNTITIGEIHVHASSSDPRAMALDFRRELETVLEGLAVEMGAPA
jgi:hypothetical protein